MFLIWERSFLNAVDFIFWSVVFGWCSSLLTVLSAKKVVCIQKKKMITDACLFSVNFNSKWKGGRCIGLQSHLLKHESDYLFLGVILPWTLVDILVAIPLWLQGHYATMYRALFTQRQNKVTQVQLRKSVAKDKRLPGIVAYTLSVDQVIIYLC